MQKPAIQHTQRHWEKQNGATKTQHVNNQGAGGMGEALRYLHMMEQVVDQTVSKKWGPRSP